MGGHPGAITTSQCDSMCCVRVGRDDVELRAGVTRALQGATGSRPCRRRARWSKTANFTGRASAASAPLRGFEPGERACLRSRFRVASSARTLSVPRIALISGCIAEAVRRQRCCGRPSRARREERHARCGTSLLRQQQHAGVVEQVGLNELMRARAVGLVHAEVPGPAVLLPDEIVGVLLEDDVNVMGEARNSPMIAAVSSGGGSAMSGAVVSEPGGRLFVGNVVPHWTPRLSWFNTVSVETVHSCCGN